MYFFFMCKELALYKKYKSCLGYALFGAGCLYRCTYLLTVLTLFGAMYSLKQPRKAELETHLADH